jgi:Flp pilus assembly protein TadG
MVEFAMVAPLFFLLLFAVFDYGRLFFTQIEIEEAVQEAGRFASTGNANVGLSRLQSVEAVLTQDAGSVGFDDLQRRRTGAAARSQELSRALRR